MPLYRYRCSDCDLEFELLTKQVSHYTFCRRCDGAAERLIGKPAVHYKGDNFTKGVEDEQN